MAERNRQGSMFDSIQSGQVEDEDDDVATAEESIDNPQIRFEEGSGVAPMNGVQDVPPNALYVPNSDYPPVAENGGSDQLTLSFQGEVYVFDAVSPDKVFFFPYYYYFFGLRIVQIVLELCTGFCVGMRFSICS